MPTIAEMLPKRLLHAGVLALLASDALCAPVCPGNFSVYSGGASCASGFLDYDLCSNNACESSTTCPNVPHGTCKSCKCNSQATWAFSPANPTYSNLAAAYNRVRTGKVELLNAACGASSGAPTEVAWTAQGAARECTGTKTKTQDSTGAVTWQYSGSVPMRQQAGCDNAYSCIGGITTSASVTTSSANMVAEFSYMALAVSDWYECVVVLFKQQGSSQNLDTDTIVAQKAIRGDKIGSGSNCPSSFTHDVCGGSTAAYSCDSTGFITDVLTVASTGTHYLAFYAASYDRTGGTALGAKMVIKDFKLTPSTCSATCTAGATSAPTCTVVTCDSGFLNANSDASDGCETKTTEKPTQAPTKVPTNVGQTYKPTMSPTTHHTYAPTVDEKLSVLERTMLIFGIVAGAVLLGGAMAWYTVTQTGGGGDDKEQSDE